MSLCKLCDIEDWKNPDFFNFASEILSQGKVSAVEHRKLWEFTKTVEALNKYNLLNEKSRGLSVAAGNERLLFFLANHTERIIATDTYGEGEFVTNEAQDSFFNNPEKHAPYDYRKKNLIPLRMNALDLKFDNNLFEFVFSMSSLEHFGGLRNSKKAIKEMLRVTKPGGLVIITTDCIIEQNPFIRFLNKIPLIKSLVKLIRRVDEVFDQQDIDYLTKDFNLVEDIDYRISTSSQGIKTPLRGSNLNALPHINLVSFGNTFTSICLVFQKKGSFSYSNIDLSEFDERMMELRKVKLPKTPINIGQRIKYLIKIFSRY